MLPATIVATLVILVLGVWTVTRQWEAISAAAAEIGLSRALGAVVLSGIGIIATGECWRRWLDALAPGIRILTAHRLFYATQVGKYLPGGVWPVLGQVSLANRLGIPRPAVLGATALFLTTHVVTGAIMGGLVLAGSGSRWSSMLVLALVGTVALSPPLTRRAAAVVARFSSGPSEVPELRLRPTLAASSIMLLAWVLYGGAVLVLLEPLGGETHEIFTVIGAAAISWLTGFMAFLAPAGIGAREGAFVALLAPLVGVPSALTVALLSRVATTMCDIALGLLSVGVVSKLTSLTDHQHDGES